MDLPPSSDIQSSFKTKMNYFDNTTTLHLPVIKEEDDIRSLNLDSYHVPPIKFLGNFYDFPYDVQKYHLK